ncbi:MAG: hypothetical protein Q9159_006861 [Coniocarpon cinnabarinum]
MPKKQQPRFNYPSNNGYVHPSLAAKRDGGQASGQPSTPAASNTALPVTVQIEHLRRTQGTSAPQTEPPSLEASQHARVIVGNRRKAPGPPPPRSWIVGSPLTPSQVQEREVLKEQWPRLSRLPGANIPPHRSLLHHSLHAMALNFDWHVAVDHVYLSVLPLDLKHQLLSYIAVHCPGGLDRNGLDVLFTDPEQSGLEDSTGSSDATRLDLGRSVGRSLTLTQLEQLMKGRRHSLRQTKPAAGVLDSWEDDMDIGKMSLSSHTQFSRLTHLSLSHPPKTISWQDLISLSRQLGSLTHLCLDFWPQPSLPEMQPAAPQHQAVFDHPVVSSKHAAIQESATLLHLLSRNTASLRWLSVAGCQPWFDALLPEADKQPSSIADTRFARRPVDLESATIGARWVSRVLRTDEGNAPDAPGTVARGPDWNGAWRHVRYVNVSQDWIPQGLRSEDLLKLVIPRKARSANREALRAEPFQLPREGENYRLSSSGDEVQRSIDERLRRRRWLLLERMSILLASKVDWKRLNAGLPTAEFDFGWGRRELLQAGYAEQTVFDAGL